MTVFPSGGSRPDTVQRRCVRFARSSSRSIGSGRSLKISAMSRRRSGVVSPSGMSMPARRMRPGARWNLLLWVQYICLLSKSNATKHRQALCWLPSCIKCDKDYPIGPRHLYYQTNRDKVSEWSCGICDISWQSARSSIMGVRRADCASLSRRYPARFRIWRRNRLQTFRPPAARREVECGWQAIPGGCEAHPPGGKRSGRARRPSGSRSFRDAACRVYGECVLARRCSRFLPAIPGAATRCGTATSTSGEFGAV